VSETSIGYSMGSHIRIMHLGMQVSIFATMELRVSAVS
jgi:hypothetical protein